MVISVQWSCWKLRERESGVASLGLQNYSWWMFPSHVTDLNSMEEFANDLNQPIWLIVLKTRFALRR